MDGLLLALKILWASPVTIMAFIIGVIGMPFGTRMQRVRYTIEFHGGLVEWLLKKTPVKAAAMTLGHVIYGRTPFDLDRTRDHEWVHVHQYERWGPFFIPAYVICSAWLTIKKRNAYFENPFELEAFASDRRRAEEAKRLRDETVIVQASQADGTDKTEMNTSPQSEPVLPATQPSETVLAIDIGNTRVKFGQCALSSGSASPNCVEFAAFDSVAEIDWKLIATWNETSPIAKIIVTGSNEQHVEQLLASCPERLPTPITLRSRKKIPIINETEVPDRVGIDRLLNGVAVNLMRAQSQPAIIVDSGTAVTVDYISANGAFTGGAILPGVRLGARGLHEYTAALPHVDAKSLLTTTPDALGRETSSAILSGLYWGHVGAVRELVAQLSNLESKAKPILIFSGGASPMLVSHFEDAIHEPFLSLQGLALTASAIDSAHGSESQP